MRTFNIMYLFISVIIVLFQAFVIPTLFCDYSKELRRNKIRKFIEQFISSVAGYALLYYLIRKGVYAVTNAQYTIFSIADILLLSIALIGISGFLSLTIYNMAGKIHNMFKK